MEQTSQQQLQSRAHEMVACLEFIKLNLKSKSKEGRVAQGKRKLKMWKFHLWKAIRICVNVALWIFIFYKLLS